jgi:hypothetical protein
MGLKPAIPFEWYHVIGSVPQHLEHCPLTRQVACCAGPGLSSPMYEMEVAQLLQDASLASSATTPTHSPAASPRLLFNCLAGNAPSYAAPTAFNTPPPLASPASLARTVTNTSSLAPYATLGGDRGALTEAVTTQLDAMLGPHAMGVMLQLHEQLDHDNDPLSEVRIRRIAHSSYCYCSPA